jgi:DNA-binding CsgD family transcriptional regulator
LCAWRSGAARAFHALGKPGRARDLAEEELAIAQEIGAPRLIAHALITLGQLDPGPAGLPALEQAIAVVEPSAPRLTHTRALVEFGAALRRTGRRSAARDPLVRGFELATRGGARRLAEYARVELAALGARPRKDVFARDRLTPSEARVVSMAADGMTNKQIAQALFVTLKTVEAHLHHAYQKLGIVRRSELRSALVDEEAGDTRPSRT